MHGNDLVKKLLIKITGKCIFLQKYVSFTHFSIMITKKHANGNLRRTRCANFVELWIAGRISHLVLHQVGGEVIVKAFLGRTADR